MRAKEPKTKLNGYEVIDVRPKMTDGRLETVERAVAEPDGSHRRDFKSETLVALPQEMWTDGRPVLAHYEHALKVEPDGADWRGPKTKSVETMTSYPDFYELPPGADPHDVNLHNAFQTLKPVNDRFYTAQQTMDNPVGLDPKVAEGLAAITAEKGTLQSPLTFEEYAAIRQLNYENMSPVNKKFIEENGGWKADEEAYEQYKTGHLEALDIREGLAVNPQRLEKIAQAQAQAAEAEQQAQSRLYEGPEMSGPASYAKSSGFDFSRGMQEGQMSIPGIQQERNDPQKSPERDVYSHPGDDVDMRRVMKPNSGKALEDMPIHEKEAMGLDATGAPDESKPDLYDRLEEIRKAQEQAERVSGDDNTLDRGKDMGDD